MRRSLLVATLLAAFPLVACGPSDDDDTSIPCNANLLAGDLVITEVFADADGSDEGKEWFEIFNTTSSAVELEGVVIYASKANGDDEVTHAMTTHIIEAGGYAVIGGVADEFRPPYVDYGYGDDLRVGSSRGLPNADGKIGLECGGVLVDDMTWSVMESGASKALDGTRSPDYQENDDLQFWCDSVTEFEQGALGTPGATNDACSTIAPTMCDDGGTVRATVPPTVGDLIITEAFPAPDSIGNGGPGGEGEWFEVYVAADVDINGLQMGQAETTGPKDVDTTLTSVACLRVTTGTYLVFAANDDSSLNGGLPQVDHTIGFGLTNSDDGVFIGYNDAPLDVVTWSSSSTGTSRALDPDNIDATSNDEDRFWCNATTTYGTQNQEGTPGAVNVSCGVIAPPDGMCYMAGGGMRAIDKAASGEIIVNELMVSPTGTDSNTEYAEFKALADFDLNGLQFGPATPAGGAGNVAQEYPGFDCMPVTSGELILAVQSLVEADNGGIPPADIDFELMVSLPAGTNGGGIFVGIDDTPLDVMTYVQDDVTGGVSIQIDPANTAQTCAPGVATTYGTNLDRGTPNLENVCE